MSGASARVLGMVRAHYARNESAFAYAAAALAKSAKSPAIKSEIEGLVRRGFQAGLTDRQRPDRPAAQAPPMSGQLYALPSLGFTDLILDPELQACLDEVVVELEYREHLAERGLRARNRMLFHGPPGNGKSSVGAALANALGVEAYCVSIPDTVSMYLGATGKNLGELFGSIREGMVVVFDELDAIGTKRGDSSSSGGKETNAIVNVLLTLLDRHKSGVIIGTTNRPDILDPALLRRFDEHILFPAPSAEQMRSLANRLCEKHKIAPVHVDACANFDEVTKTVLREARRAVMRELLAADTAEDEGPESPEGGDALH